MGRDEVCSWGGATPERRTARHSTSDPLFATSFESARTECFDAPASMPTPAARNRRTRSKAKTNHVMGFGGTKKHRFVRQQAARHRALSQAIESACVGLLKAEITSIPHHPLKRASRIRLHETQSLARLLSNLETIQEAPSGAEREASGPEISMNAPRDEGGQDLKRCLGMRVASMANQTTTLPSPGRACASS